MTMPICEKCVLIVEDDPDLRESMAEVLADHGYHPIEAGNGHEALAHLQQAAEKPCAILLDMMMPVMDGWQFREHQSNDPELSAIPVVVVSAHADTDKAREKLHVEAALKKPIQLNQLLEIVARFCHPEPTPAPA